jgi:hypothetical protein
MTEPVGSREIRESASEVKFVVGDDTARGIRDLARTLLAPDPYASGLHGDEYDTTTVYFDTPDFAVYHRRGSYRRAKYRIRRYGKGDIVFLERKLRTSDMLTKRRTHVRIEDLPLLTAETPMGEWPGRWFHERLLARRLSAVCRVAYRRTARVAMTDYGPIRLTLDERMVATAVDTPVFDTPGDARPLAAQVIVELKFRAAMPAVFKRIVEEFALQPARISKYRLGIDAARPEVAQRRETGPLLRSDA